VTRKSRSRVVKVRSLPASILAQEDYESIVESFLATKPFTPKGESPVIYDLTEALAGTSMVMTGGGKRRRKRKK
jgi:hypothetical protein